MRFQHSRLFVLIPALWLGAWRAPALAAETDDVVTRSDVMLPGLASADAPGPLPLVVGDPAIAPPPVADGKLHGMVSLGVGTRGYREAAVDVEGALPGGGYFALAASGAQIDAGRDHRIRQAPQSPPN